MSIETEKFAVFRTWVVNLSARDSASGAGTEPRGLQKKHTKGNENYPRDLLLYLNNQKKNRMIQGS